MVLTFISKWTERWFKDLAQAHKFFNSGPPRSLLDNGKEKRIKIAVLDTGIDFTHPLLKGYIDKGQFTESWDFVEDCPTLKDTNGHGTHTAHLLLKAAPNASICVARVFQTTKAVSNTAALVAKVCQPLWNS
jgi:subtilisin family serine protease